MGFLEKFSFKENKLIAFYLGGRVAKCNIEVHDVVFLVGKTSEELIPQLKEQWYGIPKSLHVDSWFALENADGYDILLSSTPSTEPLKLYFVNLGYYKEGSFGEEHHIQFIVAESINEAKLKAKGKAESNAVELHTDDIFEIDDCIEIEKVGEFHVHLVPGHKINQDPVNGWQRVV